MSEKGEKSDKEKNLERTVREKVIEKLRQGTFVKYTTTNEGTKRGFVSTEANNIDDAVMVSWDNEGGVYSFGWKWDIDGKTQNSKWMDHWLSIDQLKIIEPKFKINDRVFNKENHKKGTVKKIVDSNTVEIQYDGNTKNNKISNDKIRRIVLHIGRLIKSGGKKSRRKTNRKKRKTNRRRTSKK